MLNLIEKLVTLPAHLSPTGPSLSGQNNTFVTRSSPVKTNPLHESKLNQPQLVKAKSLLTSPLQPVTLRICKQQLASFVTKPVIQIVFIAQLVILRVGNALIAPCKYNKIKEYIYTVKRNGYEQISNSLLGCYFDFNFNLSYN